MVDDIFSYLSVILVSPFCFEDCLVQPYLATPRKKKKSKHHTPVFLVYLVICGVVDPVNSVKMLRRVMEAERYEEVIQMVKYYSNMFSKWLMFSKWYDKIR